jgi:DNA polymerase
VLVVVDSAQIEARVLAWLANDVELLSLFSHKEDVYKHMAARIYGMPQSEVTKDERFVGKVATLGLGYGMGQAKFRLTMALGSMGPPKFLNDDEAWRVVNAYRSSRSDVTALWRRMEAMMYSMTKNRDGEYKCLRWDGALKRVFLPNGMYLQYPYLRLQNGQYEYFDYKTIVRNKFSREPDEEKGKLLHGGVLVENVVQALARIIIGEQMLTIKKYLSEVGDGFYRRIVTMTHDEVVVCVPAEEAEATLGYMMYALRTPPVWAPDLPLDAEGGYAENYSK